jgi:hypothetical protein
VVGVAVGEDHGGDRLVPEVPARERQRVARGRLGGERIHHDPALLAVDQRHVGEVEAAQLMDARSDLVEARAVVEPGLSPEAGVHCVRRLALEERELRQRARRVVAVRIRDLLGIGRRDEPALGVREGAPIGEVERTRHAPVALGGERRGVGPGGLESNRLLTAGNERRPEQADDEGDDSHACSPP